MRATREVKVIIPVPANYVGNINKEVRLAFAIDLFRRGIISLKRASEIAGIPVYDFIVKLRERNIKAFNYSDEELGGELDP